MPTSFRLISIFVTLKFVRRRVEAKESKEEEEAKFRELESFCNVGRLEIAL